MKRLVVYHGYLRDCVNYRIRLAVGDPVSRLREDQSRRRWTGLELLWSPLEEPWVSFQVLKSGFNLFGRWGKKRSCLSVRSLRNRADDGVYSVLSKDITGRRPMDDEREWIPLFVERLFPHQWGTMKHLTFRYDWGCQ